VWRQDGWEHVTTSENVTVYRKYLDVSGLDGGICINRQGRLEIVEEQAGAASKFACVKVRVLVCGGRADWHTHIHFTP
jgi:hypothetical protein